MTPATIGTRKYLDLLWQYTKRGVAARHKGSYLGSLWPVLTPLLMLGLYTTVFGFIFGGSFGVSATETRLDFALALFVGLNTIHFVCEIIGAASSVVVGAPNLVKKVVFPLTILPVSTVGIALTNHLISMVLVFIGIGILGPGLSWNMLLWPLILLPMVVMGLGLSFLLSAFGVFIRDISQLTSFVSIVLLYCSAVFFPLSKVVPTPFWKVLKFNPVIHAIEMSRHSLIWNMPLGLKPMLYLYSSSFLILLAGFFIFKKFRPAFADVL
jgi:lipopolysaccharide transport system permease protein